MSESDAVTALQRLGLSKYEASVFVALQRLGTGTAREVADETDVPRSQVYGAAERLEERGLVEIQQASPIRYRPVSLEEARDRLRDRFDREADRAFDSLADVRHEAESDGEQEAVWTVEGREAVVARTTALIDEAERRLVYSGDADHISESVTEALADASEEGVAVVAVSADDVADRFAGTGVTVHRLPDSFEDRSGAAGRLLVADDDAMLVSVDQSEGDETAIWSADTGFASVFIRLADTWFGSEVDL
ncbi:MAG: TrmB family transcriptional regulator [Halobacteriaceae archaeon]